MVTTTTTKSWSPMWNCLDLSCLLCAVCKSVFTDGGDISTLYYIDHLDMVTSTTTKSWSPMWNSLDLSCLCVLYVNQSLLIAEIYQHSIASTTLTWSRPPRAVYILFFPTCFFLQSNDRAAKYLTSLKTSWKWWWCKISETFQELRCICGNSLVLKTCALGHSTMKASLSVRL